KSCVQVKRSPNGARHFYSRCARSLGGEAAAHQDHHGARTNRVTALLRQHFFGTKLCDVMWRSLHGINEAIPATPREMRQLEDVLLPMRVGDEINIICLLPLSPVHVHRQAARLPGPVWLPQLDTMPGDVQGAIFLVASEGVTTKQRMHPPKLDELLEKPEQVGMRLEEAPIDPTDLIVLTVGVVGAVWRTYELTSGKNQGGPSGEQENGRKVAHLPLTQPVDLRSLGRSLTAAVPALVIIITVGVTLAVGLVVFAVIGDEISEREAIVAGDEVQAVIGPPATG